MKVYCKDCTWYKFYRFWDEGVFRIYYCYCHSKFKKEWIDTPIKRVKKEDKIHGSDFEKYNKNNDCTDHKHKWWKFWIKGENNHERTRTE